MNSFNNFDKELEFAISDITEKITPSPNMFEEINKKIEHKSNGGYYMKINKSKKIRTILIACFLLILTTATCFAAAKFILYTSLPSNKSVSNEIGFNPKYIKEFKNGYVFLEGGVNKDWSISDGSNDLEMRYVKDDNIINYHAIKSIKGETSLNDFISKPNENETLEKINISANIPGAYIYNTEYIIIFWEENNVTYQLSQYNKILDILQISKAELIEMAQEISNSEIK